MLTVKVGEIGVPDEFPFEIFVTALEGGIGYWFRTSEYHWSTNHKDDLFGFYAKGVTHDDELDVGPIAGERLIDRETIVKGIGLALTNENVGLAERWHSRIVAAVLAAAVGDIDYDADDADHIVQIGMFGRVIYG